MNHQISSFNQNLPVIRHTDWASMAKQWATSRANVNIPSSMNKVETHPYHNIPPPPPPPPPSITIPKMNNTYNQEYNDQIYNRNLLNKHTNNSNIYELPHTRSMIYNELMPNNSSQCETFDYNHRDRPYVNFNNVHPMYKPVQPQPPNNNASFSQNLFNFPPPTHQDYMENNHQTFIPDVITTSAPPPKLFPICNPDPYDSIVKTQPLLVTPKTPVIAISMKSNKFEHIQDFSTSRSNKGLPAWIIDDMKKIKEKEKKQPFSLSMDDYKDHPVNSKRDEEGDIVMEDVIKESESDGLISGKSVITTNRIDLMTTTEIDIDDVNLNDEDDGFYKIDYSSKSLIDLIEMLNENELENLKMDIIRDSLTGIMKQVTDDMISDIVNSTFTGELCKMSSKSQNVKNVSSQKGIKIVNCNSDAIGKSVDPPSNDYVTESTCHLLGLDVYESDDENNDGNFDYKNETKEVKNQKLSEGRERWSTHKKSVDSKVDKKSLSLPSSSNSKDNQKSISQQQSIEKKKSSTDTASSSKNSSPKRKNRSKSRDRHNRSPEYRKRSRSKERSHKKSKKHNRSPEPRDNKWKNDKYDKNNNNNKKRSKRDRSRS